MLRRTAIGLAIAWSVVCLARPVHTAPAPPKLVVILVVDQMRADYVDRFQSDWTSGLKRLVTSGAWFRRAAYPYLTTVTCAGHATIGTGTFPHTHGIIQNTWWDRGTSRIITCSNDPNAKPITYGSPVAEGDSAARLMVPTFADVMRTEHGAHVVSLSLKARSAIMLAGHGGDAVTWLNDALDGWVSSTMYGGPVAAVKAFTSSHPIEGDLDKTWERSKGKPADREVDDGLGEAPPGGWTSTFPHVLKGAGSTADMPFRLRWERSPYGDAYVGRFAASLVESLKLGTHDHTDVLAVSFSSPDLVGHAFGPNSVEIREMYRHLDVTIGDLLDRLDALVGRDRYVVALSADHGVTPIPEQLVKAGKDGGRLDPVVMSARLEAALQAALGPGRYVARVNGNDVYFAPGMYQKLVAAPQAMTAAVKVLRDTPGIASVFPSAEVARGQSAKDSNLRAAALMYVPGRSGDIVVVPKPGWMFSTSGTTHGTANEDDQRVPLVFFGSGIKRGKYMDPATPADVAPTLATICGVTLSKVEGHALTQALTR